MDIKAAPFHSSTGEGLFISKDVNYLMLQKLEELEKKNRNLEQEV